MGTVTYSEAAVAEALNTHFVPVRVNVTEEAAKPLTERYRQVWTPDLRVLGPDGFEYDRWYGYLPPFEFLPQLLVAGAHARLRRHDFAGAAAVYEEVLSRFPTSAAAPEAQYFLGVARYKETHEGQELMRQWRRLREVYPHSIWRVKQCFTEPVLQPASATTRAA